MKAVRRIAVGPLGLLAAVTLLISPGCGSSASPQASDRAVLTVFAAASLKNSFSTLGARFEAVSGAEVTFSFAGSADLVAQLQQGAPADVFAAADGSTMDLATGDDLVDGRPVDFASNTLEIAVPPGNPAGVRSLADLSREELKVVVCAPQVPCGAATAKVQRAAGIQLSPVSEENSVTDVVNKVRSREADAGLVYRTDVAASAGALVGIAFPEARRAVNVYPIAVLDRSTSKDLARRFVDLVTGAEGRQLLADAGFEVP